MGEKLKRRAIYLTTIAAMIAMTGGFVVATTITSIATPPGQGGAFGSAGTPPAGVATTGMLISQASATAGATANSLGSPDALTATTSSVTDTVHVNAVGAAGDFIETVTVTLTAGSSAAPASTEYEISFMIAGSTSSPQLVFVETTGTFASPAVDTVALQWDMGSGSSSITITSVSDLVTQCSSVGTCS